MQQMTPPQGRLFPDTPKQQSAPRFASNAPQGAQAYEPQLRMQQTGSVPVMTMPRYATGQLQALHGAQPVTQMPPMSSLPTVSVYQAMQAQPVNIPQTALEGTPIMVHTVQGAPVVVTKEEMERALASLEDAIADLFPAGSADQTGSLLTDQRQEEAARRAADAIGRAQAALESGLTPDAILTDAEEALDALGELTGRCAREEIVSRIFSRFCVGK